MYGMDLAAVAHAGRRWRWLLEWDYRLVVTIDHHRDDGDGTTPYSSWLVTNTPPQVEARAISFVCWQCLRRGRAFVGTSAVQQLFAVDLGSYQVLVQWVLGPNDIRLQYACFDYGIADFWPLLLNRHCHPWWRPGSFEDNNLALHKSF